MLMMEMIMMMTVVIVLMFIMYVPCASSFMCLVSLDPFDALGAATVTTFAL